MNSFLIALMFFTRINIRKELDFSDREIEKSMRKTPLIGLLLGSLLFISAYAFDYLGIDGALVGLLIYTIYIYLTGGIHIDGFSDTLDGIYSNRDKDRMLEIMQDSRVGVFGALGIIILSLFYVLILAEIERSILFLFPIVSRTIIIYTCAKFRYAKEEGMGKIFMQFADIRFFYISIIFLLAFSVYVDLYIAVSIIITLLLTIIWINKISKKLYGITGDVLGFSIEISQILFIMIYYILERM